MVCLLDTEQAPVTPCMLVIHDNRTIRGGFGDRPFKLLTYQFPTVGHWLTDGELGFDSGAGTRETDTTSKEGTRRESYQALAQGASDKK